MPVYKKPPRVSGPELESLVEGLVGELNNPKEFGQPIVLEDSTPETNSLPVHVIWDRWAEYDKDFRYTVILNAYEQARGKEIRDQITLALGLTVPEAAAIGLLPFLLRPAAGASGPRDLDENLRAAMLQLGASTLNDPKHPELRFAHQEDVEAASAHLKDVLPHTSWLIYKFVDPDTLE
jgi:hypothetical protein